VTDGLYLVARLIATEVCDDMSWLTGEEWPFRSVDPIDFETDKVFALYEEVYRKIDTALNVSAADELLEFTRWVLITDEQGGLMAFVCFKMTESGLKLGLTASTDAELARSALKRVLRNALNLDGVYGEISPPVEFALVGYVPEVPCELAQAILGKAVTLEDDGASMCGTSRTLDRSGSLWSADRGSVNRGR
jgi:hypothetical protein